MTQQRGSSGAPPRDPDLEAKIRRGIEGLVPDAVKKLALAGVGALFMTEEGIRNLLSEMKLPREAVGSVLASTEKARSELFRMIAEEFRKFLEHSNISGELARALTGVTVDITASVSFRPNEAGELVPQVETASTTRREPAAPPDDTGSPAGEEE